MDNRTVPIEDGITLDSIDIKPVYDLYEFDNRNNNNKNDKNDSTITYHAKFMLKFSSIKGLQYLDE